MARGSPRRSARTPAPRSRAGSMRRDSRSRSLERPPDHAYEDVLQGGFRLLQIVNLRTLANDLAHDVADRCLVLEDERELVDACAPVTREAEVLHAGHRLEDR